jgi:hypothetical protein
MTFDIHCGLCGRSFEIWLDSRSIPCIICCPTCGKQQDLVLYEDTTPPGTRIWIEHRREQT